MKALMVGTVCLSVAALLMVFVPGTPLDKQEAQREAELELIRHLTHEYIAKWEAEDAREEVSVFDEPQTLPDGPPAEPTPQAPPEQELIPIPKLDLMVMQAQARQGRILRKLAPGGQVAEWAAKLDNPPPWEDQHNMATLLHDYPVELSMEDGLWLLDRIFKRDWVPGWGPSLDEAIILWFTPQRIAEACSPKELRWLRVAWEEEGYFAP